MKLFIKNMVCSRCSMVIKTELEKLNIIPIAIRLGEVEIEGVLSKETLKHLDNSLRSIGFEIMDDRKSQTIEKIKTEIILLVHHSEQHIHTTLSDHLSAKLLQDYHYLSNLFSEVEGTTIEKYFIAQRIEKAKELLVYDQLTLSQIADQLGYSSVAYLSNQFKKITGLTPSFFKKLQGSKRRNIDDL